MVYTKYSDVSSFRENAPHLCGYHAGLAACCIHAEPVILLEQRCKGRQRVRALRHRFLFGFVVGCCFYPGFLACLIFMSDSWIS